MLGYETVCKEAAKVKGLERDNRVLRLRLRAIRRTLREFANQVESGRCNGLTIREFVTKLREAGL